jgi:restriction endonuclease S subunit
MHKAQETITKLELEKLSPEMRQTAYGETDIKKILKKKVELMRTNKPETAAPFTRYKRSHRIVYERDPQEIEDKRQEEEFKSLFMSQLNKWHNLLRGCSVTGEEALDDILYCLFLCYLSPKVSTEGDFDLANSLNSCYKGTIQRKVKDWTTKLNINYLIENTAELVTTKEEDSSIYKCGELMSRHPMTKGLIKNKSFLNCKKKLILSQLLKDCRDFASTHNIFNKIDIIGIAWEYFNTKHGGNGGASKERGQYFTERPVMGMCCQLIERSHIEELGIDNDSTLGDEFCATFGFPLYAKKFLKQKFQISIQDKKMYGVEYADRLSRFGIMNAMFSLTNFKHIRSGDSFVTNVSSHLDVSVHNVPMGHAMDCANIKEMYISERAKEDSNLPEFKDVVPIEKNGDAMLSCQVVVYKTKKMGLVIIKDGEETTGASNKKWREWFCDSCVIHKIMKIPTGAFSHTGTKTACIYFTKREGQTTEKIQFLKMSDTGDKITEICEVTRSDLQQNNYSWDPNVYIVDEEMEKLMASSGCEWKKLGEVCEIKNGTQLDKKNMVNGIYKVYGGGKQIVGYHNNFNRESGHIIIAATGNYSGFVTYSNNPFWASQCFTINSFNNIINNKFLYYLCKYVYQSKFMDKQKGGAQSYIRINDFKDMDIPIPPQETQTQVVQTLDDLGTLRQNYMDIRDGLERRMKYYFEMMIKRHRGEITMEKLGDVCEIKTGKYITRDMKIKGEYPVYGGGNPSFYINQYNYEDEIIIAKDGVSENCVRYEKNKFFLNHHGWVIKTKDSKKYLYYNLVYNEKRLYKLAHGSGQKGINQDNFKSLEIQVHKPETQTQIVQYLDNLESEKNKITETLHQLDTEMREILTQSYQSGDTNTQHINTSDEQVHTLQQLSGDTIIQTIDTSDEQVQTLQQITADPLPISPGEWQGDV